MVGLAVALLGLVVPLASCGGGSPAAPPAARGESSSAAGATATPSGGQVSTTTSAGVPLRTGERFRTLEVPGGPYTPSAPSGGLDDYHCFLLDPGLTHDAFVTGTDVLPGNPRVVHHAILFTVPPRQVAAAEAHDAATPGRGWTCFGGSALPSDTSTVGASLDSAPWLAAWAPGGGESVFGDGTGKFLPEGSRVVLQVHYNLREGAAPDRTAVRLRLRPGTAHLQRLQTMLLVAPVELPCLPSESGFLCDRTRAVNDLVSRFGPQAGSTVAGLQLLCGGSLTHPKAGTTQSCDRRVPHDMVVRAVAGHMHLLGRSIAIRLNPGTASARTLLDRKVWNFDDQRMTALRSPVAVRAGNVLRVTCTHDAALRSMLPALRHEQPRYVTWGEGTSDEMCLGIVMYTRR